MSKMLGIDATEKDPDARVEERLLRAFKEQAVKDAARHFNITLVVAIVAFSVFVASLIPVVLGYGINPVAVSMALAGAVTALFGVPLARTRRYALSLAAFMVADSIKNDRVRDCVLALLALEFGRCHMSNVAEQLSEWSADAPPVMRPSRPAVIADSPAPADTVATQRVAVFVPSELSGSSQM